jgi:uncharacterized protein
MNYKYRACSERLRRYIENFPVVVISGARQVGKSTLLAHLLPDWRQVVFDPVVDVGNARVDPELFLENHPFPLVLDEIQYSPELVPCLKRRVDQNKTPGMYVLTGSQQWSVMKSISESLAGRAVFIDLEGFSMAEISGEVSSKSWLEGYLDDSQAFLKAPQTQLSSTRTLYEQLWRGWLPDANQLPQDLLSDYFSGYQRTYIERDVRLILEVEDAQLFGRFCQLSSALTAQEINFSQLGRELGLTPQTAKRWLAVLRETFQWFEVPAYHGNSLKKITGKPKGYVADTGLACHYNRISSPEALSGHPMLGALFETAVMAELRKAVSILHRKPQIYHWRAHSGAEVDVVLERDNVLYPLEIKATARPSRKDTRGFQSFRKYFPDMKIAPGLLLGPVQQVEALSEQAWMVPWTCVAEDV